MVTAVWDWKENLGWCESEGEKRRRESVSPSDETFKRFVGFLEGLMRCSANVKLSRSLT